MRLRYLNKELEIIDLVFDIDLRNNMRKVITRRILDKKMTRILSIILTYSINYFGSDDILFLYCRDMCILICFFSLPMALTSLWR